MKPSQVAEALRLIASRIENSKSPRRELVARDLKQVLVHVAADSFKMKPLENAYTIKGSGIEGIILTSPGDLEGNFEYIPGKLEGDLGFTPKIPKTHTLKEKTINEIQTYLADKDVYDVFTSSKRNVHSAINT